MKLRLALPSLAGSPTSSRDRVPPAIDQRRIARVRFLFVTAWIAVGLALALAALAVK